MISIEKILPIGKILFLGKILAIEQIYRGYIMNVGREMCNSMPLRERFIKKEKKN